MGVEQNSPNDITTTPLCLRTPTHGLLLFLIFLVLGIVTVIAVVVAAVVVRRRVAQIGRFDGMTLYNDWGAAIWSGAVIRGCHDRGVGWGVYKTRMDALYYSVCCLPYLTVGTDSVPVHP